MNNSIQHIESYNNNTYITILTYLHGRLSEVEDFFINISKENGYKRIDDLTELYSDIFSDNRISGHINYKIEKIYKAGYLRNPGPKDKGNSYFHLTLLLNAKNLIWLDVLYNSVLSRLLKFYKHFFSKIDNYFISFDAHQLEKYQAILNGIQAEVAKFLNANAHREIIANRKKLSEQQLSNIPFGGLFYTAHLNNIKSILEHGILSHNLAHARGVVNFDISNPQVNDRRNRVEHTLGGNIHDFTPLYINPKNPMLYYLCSNGHREQLILLKVTAHILLADNVAFSDGNAAVKTTHFYKSIDDFNKLNWTVIKDVYWTKHPDGKRIRCSEVLVKEKIPIYYVTDLFVYNQETLCKVLPLFPNHIGIRTSINKQLYF